MKIPVKDDRFGSLSKFFSETGEESYEFNNGLVWARHVDAWDDGMLHIMEWAAFAPHRSGNTRKTLQQLREFFTVIDVSGIYEKDHPEAPAAWYCWQKMLDEGLIDSAMDQNGVKLKKTKALKP